VAAPKKYPDELRARAVRLYRESDPKPVIRRLAEQLGVHHEALRNWIRQAEADAGERHDRPTTEVAEENRRLRHEVAELRRVNEILRAASSYFASTAGTTPAASRKNSTTSALTSTRPPGTPRQSSPSEPDIVTPAPTGSR
jgi:transposase-like protein